jgi:Tol biopolymer transport system component
VLRRSMRRLYRPGFAGLACCLAAAALTLCASTASATYPGANGRIAFVGRILFADKPMPGCSTDLYEAHICTMEPDGSRLKHVSSFGSRPSWSANGGRIAFSARWIWTMKADGTDKTKIPSTRGYRFRSPAFSPTGGRIVYDDYRPNVPPNRRGAIYTIRTDGTGKRLLFAGGAIPETPGYSPDGSRIVFAGKPNHRPWGIWTIRPDGTGLRAVTTNPRYPAFSDRDPDWSPNGSQIVFVHTSRSDGRSPTPWPLKFVRPDGSGLHGNGEIGVDGAGYRFAPSGDILVSTAYDDQPDPACGDIFTVPVVGGSRTLVTDNCANLTGLASQPSWQPLPDG